MAPGKHHRQRVPWIGRNTRRSNPSVHLRRSTRDIAGVPRDRRGRPALRGAWVQIVELSDHCSDCGHLARSSQSWNSIQPCRPISSPKQAGEACTLRMTGRARRQQIRFRVSPGATAQGHAGASRHRLESAAAADVRRNGGAVVGAVELFKIPAYLLPGPGSVFLAVGDRRGAAVDALARSR